MLENTAMIIIDYYSIDKTIEYIGHFNNVFGHLPSAIIIVDNSGDVEFFKKAEKKLDDEFKMENSNNIFRQYSIEGSKASLYFISSKENVGFAKGNNNGLKFVSNNLDDSFKYILFSNNDIRLGTEKKIDWELVDSMFVDHPEIGIIGFEQVDLNGNSQNPGKKRSIWIDHVYPFIFKKQLRRGFEDIYKENALSQVEWISGAFFIGCRKTMEKVGGFDPNTFLYYEEPILAVRVRRVNKQVCFTNLFKIVHEDGFTTKKKSSHLSNIHYQSTVHFFENYTNSKLGVSIFKFLFWASNFKRKFPKR